jgi:hypothetical protein
MLELHVLSTHSISVNEPSLRYVNSRQETINNPIREKQISPIEILCLQYMRSDNSHGVRVVQSSIFYKVFC